MEYARSRIHRYLPKILYLKILIGPLTISDYIESKSTISIGSNQRYVAFLGTNDRACYQQYNHAQSE